MVSSEHLTGLYIAIPVYFLLLAVATYWAYVRTERMKHQGTNDHLSAHYLGGRDFGPFLTAGTLYASLFSGYTVVGIPNEAYATGWNALRWVSTVYGFVFGYMSTSLRIRRAGLLRNHQSPTDLITDRYQSQVLRYTTLLLQLLPSIVYLAAQIIAIKVTFNSIFNLDPDAAYPVVIIMLCIVLFEWLGGLSSVAITDSVQAVVMVCAFICIPCVIFRNFGGWQDLDPETYPKPQFYQTPTRQTQWKYWQFSLVNFAFLTLPHLIQRVYAAKDLKSMKYSFTVVTLAPWFTSIVPVFMGTMAVAFLVNADGTTPATPASPFTAILEALMDLGGFPKGIAIVAVVASLAAIMSTADSILIAISQLVTVEIIYPLTPNASPNLVTWYGRCVSLLATVFSLLIGLYWKEGLTALTAVQFPLSAQAVPTFLFALFAKDHRTDVHPWCLAIAGLTSCAYVFVVYFLHIQNNPDALPIDAGVSGFALNMAIVISLEAVRRAVFGNVATDGTTTVFPGRPQWDMPKWSRFGDKPLTPQLLWKSMEGTNEVITNPWFVVGMVFAITMMTPMVPGLEPPISADGVFAYEPSVVNGLPWWAFKIIMFCLPPTVLLLYAIYQYPNEYFTPDEKKIETEGIDPDLVELTREEMGRRTSYDEQNVLVQRRKSSIVATMEELGLTKEMDIEEEKATRRMSTPSQRKLVSLVSARRLENHNEQTDKIDEAAEEMEVDAKLAEETELTD